MQQEQVFELQNYEKNTSISATMAVPSGKRRVDFYKLEEQRPKNELQDVLLNYIQEQGKLHADGGDSAIDLSKMTYEEIGNKALFDGKLTPEMLRNATKKSSDVIEKNNLITIQQFRVSVNVAQLPTGWKELFLDDDFLLEQDIVKMENWVNSFRTALA